jgi:hypothetical protein
MEKAGNEMERGLYRIGGMSGKRDGGQPDRLGDIRLAPKEAAQEPGGEGGEGGKEKPRQTKTGPIL